MSFLNLLVSPRTAKGCHSLALTSPCPVTQFSQWELWMFAPAQVRNPLTRLWDFPVTLASQILSWTILRAPPLRCPSPRRSEWSRAPSLSPNPGPVPLPLCGLGQSPDPVLPRAGPHAGAGPRSVC